MSDMEKVIEGLQIERECVSRDCDRDCGKCDLVQDRDWLLSVYDDAIALLKEQEAVKPKIDAFGHPYCPKCKILVYETWEFCPHCGQEMEW